MADGQGAPAIMMIATLGRQRKFSIIRKSGDRTRRMISTTKKDIGEHSHMFTNHISEPRSEGTILLN